MRSRKVTALWRRLVAGDPSAVDCSETKFDDFARQFPVHQIKLAYAATGRVLKDMETSGQPRPFNGCLLIFMPPAISSTPSNVSVIGSVP